jgi:hypothetical protein
MLVADELKKDGMRSLVGSLRMLVPNWNMRRMVVPSWHFMDVARPADKMANATKIVHASVVTALSSSNNFM